MRFWRALERLGGGAVMLEWARELGPDLDHARPFLALDPNPAKTYPCTNPAGCGFPHRIEPQRRGRWIALGDMEEWCAPIRVGADDLHLFKVDTAMLGGKIAGAARLGSPTTRKSTGARAELIGTHGPAQSEVYLMFPGDNARMAREVERLFRAQSDPFLLLTPTGIHCSSEVDSALRRQSCLHISLASVMKLSGGGSLTALDTLQPMLERFARVVGERNGLARWRVESDPATSTRNGKAAGPTGSENKRVSLGRLQYLPGFQDVWLGDEHYNLRKWKKAQLCLQFLIERKAFNAKSAVHLDREIDPFVRSGSGLPPAPNSEVKIHHYFNDKGPLRELCRQVVTAAGRRRYFLKKD